VRADEARSSCYEREFRHATIVSSGAGATSRTQAPEMPQK